MPRSIIMFAFATLLPIPLITMAALFGGLWVVLAFLYMTLFTFSLDELVTVASDPTQPEREFPAADQLSTILAVSHFFLIGLVVWAISSNSNLGFLDSLGLFVAAGLFFGQVSNSNAHELIHRADRRLFNLGKWVYISLLFGHHTSAHPHIHHRFAASDFDPNSAPKGESFYTFSRRAWIESARAGFELESALLKKARKKPARFSHPYYSYFLGAFATMALAALIGGWAGLAVLFMLAFYAQTQLLLSDYVQHYGLRRALSPNGRLEPIGDHHSWNAPHWYSNYLMLAAPRHSDHHAHPSKPYPSLRLPSHDEAPSLPRSLPVMALIALYPALWRRVMDPLLAPWEERAKQTARKLAVQDALMRDPVPEGSGGGSLDGRILPELGDETPTGFPSSDGTAGQPTGRTNLDGRRSI